MCGTCGCDEPVRTVSLERDILADNDARAAANRAHFAAHGLWVVNMLSSPGSGKTSLLVRTIQDGAAGHVAVIEGDQQTDRDAARIRATGAPAVQVNTGKVCHLEADMVAAGFARLHDRDHIHGGVLFIENVGNLVCPAAFDLGESARVVMLSVTEGDDKPEKYPDMFHTADLVVIAKADLLPHVDFDVAACREALALIAPQAEVMLLSARTGEGLDGWYGWLRKRGGLPADARPHVHDHAHA